jgi:hypothetical protein
VGSPVRISSFYVIDGLRRSGTLLNECLHLFFETTLCMNTINSTYWKSTENTRLDLFHFIPIKRAKVNHRKRTGPSRGKLSNLPNQTRSSLSHPRHFWTNFQSPLTSNLRLKTNDKSLQDQPSHLSSRPKRPLRLAQANFDFSFNFPASSEAHSASRGTCVTKTLETRQFLAG